MRRTHIRPCAGRHRGSGDPGTKARAFPGGAARSRLRATLWPATIEDAIVAWVGRRRVAPAGAMPDAAEVGDHGPGG